MLSAVEKFFDRFSAEMYGIRQKTAGVKDMFGLHEVPEGGVQKRKIYRITDVEDLLTKNLPGFRTAFCFTTGSTSSLHGICAGVDRCWTNQEAHVNVYVLDM